VQEILSSTVRAPLGALGPADLLIGVTGKLRLDGVEAEVRAGLERAFDAIDAASPHTPKVLLSALAAGADLLAAETALARPGWRVVAPLPLPPALYRADFTDRKDLARFEAMLAHPQVRTIVLQSLRDPKANRQYAEADLARRPDGNPRRTLHYEQVGLFIAERCALLLAICPADEPPGRIGGSARILRNRIQGPVDAAMEEVRRQSRELLDEGSLAEPRTGPAWRIATGGGLDPGALTILAPGGGIAPFDDLQARADSLRWVTRLEAFNRRTPAVAARPPPGDPVELLQAVRGGLTGVQRRLARRVRLSVWGIAALFCAALVCLELHIELSAYAWTGGLVVAYVGFAAAAIVLFLGVSSLGWQPISEDYRAIAEALRIQIVFWRSGYESRSDRVDLLYLRGLHGSLGWIREAIGQFVAAAKLQADLPPPDHSAARRWIAGQIDFFEQRIARRTREVFRVRIATWFLFVVGLVQAIILSAMQLSSQPTFFDHLIEAELRGGASALQVLEAAAVIAGLYAVASRLGRAEDAERRPWAVQALRGLQTLAAVAAGGVLAVALCRLAGLLPPAATYDDHKPWVEEIAERLLMLAVVLPAAFAGALRFVADKLSWEAELQGYERAVSHFKRADHALGELDAQGRTAATRRRRQAIVLDLAAEALRENEAWLVAHRERPLEPVVGG
jgi:hypothetical protein